ncbi:MAG: hypothetical protein A3C46_01425 [Deltaproteobacteria bacterium RIFCSPHIGHO2_02_FULL_44_16]|nr:MAG: hypothetical protein A3C46_01425 [Deltaproteobacteria bacterium RIFCSPHIGHO2_02_FULL_44_16]
MKSSNTDVEQFLKQVIERFGDVSDGTKEIFKLLVETTLDYSENLKTSGNNTLTVGETKIALDAFMEIMKTHEIPKNLSGNSYDLVIRWLEEIKKTVHH